MFKKITGIITEAFGRKNNDEEQFNLKEETENSVNNISVKTSQVTLFVAVLIVIMIGLGALVLFIQEKTVDKVIEIKPEELKVELADKALDGEVMWRNYHEDALKKKADQLNLRIDKTEETVEETKTKLLEDTQAEIAGLKEQLKVARQELSEASHSLKEVAVSEQERINRAPVHTAPDMGVQEFGDDTEYDIPKSAATYVPEGTYFTGYLLGGYVLSTGLNTPDENAIPITIRLTGRGNLASENKTDISKCQILGSAYGDLSSERGNFRLEKLVCKENGMYITSNIAGDIHGPDGFNGIKGKVVSTGSKHIKNAMIGGVISGLSNSAKGQEGMSLSTGGLISTKKKGFKDMASGGMLTGVSNAGDKVADYYLRQAEAMSPVLEIPGGVKINTVINKGFFMGELGTHRKIKNQRTGKSETIARQKPEVKRARMQEQANAIQEGGENNDNW